jgi:hypothetical protein
MSRTHPEVLKRGESATLSKLTEADVCHILRSVRGGRTRISLSRELRVSETLVQNIVAGRSWVHVYARFMETE